LSLFFLKDQGTVDKVQGDMHELKKENTRNHIKNFIRDHNQIVIRGNPKKIDIRGTPKKSPKTFVLVRRKNRTREQTREIGIPQASSSTSQ